MIINMYICLISEMTIKLTLFYEELFDILKHVGRVILDNAYDLSCTPSSLINVQIIM